MVSALRSCLTVNGRGIPGSIQSSDAKILNHQGFQIDFEQLGWGHTNFLPQSLRTLRKSFSRLVFLIAFQHVSKHARTALTEC